MTGHPISGLDAAARVSVHRFPTSFLWLRFVKTKYFPVSRNSTRPNGIIQRRKPESRLPKSSVVSFRLCHKRVDAKRKNQRYDAHVDRTVVSPSGDMAHEYGTSHMDFDGSDEQHEDFTAPFVRVWKAAPNRRARAKRRSIVRAPQPGKNDPRLGRVAHEAQGWGIA